MERLFLPVGKFSNRPLPLQVSDIEGKNQDSSTTSECQVKNTSGVHTLSKMSQCSSIQ